jgi:hypothetical protein
MQSPPQLQLFSCLCGTLASALARKERKLRLEEMEVCVREVTLGTGSMGDYIILPVESTTRPFRSLSPKQ